ncbi:hypothetical protein PIB30_023573 [Stylosanthes scabra]|uniref:Uncharacterized protein n=1 Tax=Stylosanthes scabra TaxID=79078 RepID=A0ABU6XB64_9FABA|nr:hypothetical protein [Stylosanthes scabra]
MISCTYISFVEKRDGLIEQRLFLFLQRAASLMAHGHLAGSSLPLERVLLLLGIEVDAFCLVACDLAFVVDHRDLISKIKDVELLP